MRFATDVRVSPETLRAIAVAAREFVIPFAHHCAATIDAALRLWSLYPETSAIPARFATNGSALIRFELGSDVMQRLDKLASRLSSQGISASQVAAGILTRAHEGLEPPPPALPVYRPRRFRLDEGLRILGAGSIAAEGANTTGDLMGDPGSRSLRVSRGEASSGYGGDF